MKDTNTGKCGNGLKINEASITHKKSVMKLAKDPTLAQCIQCGYKPRLHDAFADSNFYACECRDKKYGLHSKVTYYGWTDLPKSWKFPWYTNFRYYLAEKILCKLR